MDIHKNQNCPCGSGKKVKFCCSADIASDLQKVGKMLESDQPTAAMEQLKRLAGRHPDRPALLVLKGTLEMEKGEMADAAKTVEDFAAAHPDHPAAMGMLTMIEIARNNFRAAMRACQHGLEVASQSVPLQLFQAVGLLGEGLWARGRVVPARGYLSLQAAMSGGKTTRPLEVLAQINSSPAAPLLLKKNLQLSEPPPEAPWKGPFEDALKPARRGAWGLALKKFRALDDHIDSRAPVLRNVAILESFLGGHKAAALAWRQYADLEDIPHDEAVEAEALANWLSADETKAKLDRIIVSYPVHDMEALMERFRNDNRIDKHALPEDQSEQDAQERPKAVYSLLDKPMLESGAEVTLESVPRRVATLMLYPKTTEREPSLQMLIVRGDDFDRHIDTLYDACGELISKEFASSMAGSESELAEALAMNFRFPDDTPPEVRERLRDENLRRVMLEKWPQLPSGGLEGRKPIDAASDPQWRRRLEAEVLSLELNGEAAQWGFDCNELREKLGLPAQQPIELGDRSVRDLSVAQVPRLDHEKLSDEQLADALRVAVGYHIVRAVHRMAEEVIRRGGAGESMTVSNAHTVLSHFARRFDQAEEHFNKARELDQSDKAAAQWELEKLDMCLRHQELEKGVQIMQELQEKHSENREVMQGMIGLLARYGLLQDAPGAAEQPAAQEAGKTDQPKKLILPGAQEGEGSEGKSKLVLPS